MISNKIKASSVFDKAWQRALETGVTPDMEVLFRQFIADHPLQDHEWFVLLWLAEELVAKRAVEQSSSNSQGLACQDCGEGEGYDNRF